jgi:hypothetical protein
MSKLGTLVAIPVALWGLKQLQKQFPDDPNAKPLITIGPAGTDMDIAPLFPTGKLELTTTIPGGPAVATGPTQPLGTGVTATPVPFFPETAGTFTPTGLGLPSADFTGFQEFEYKPFTPGEGIFDLSQPIEFKPFTLTGIE